MVTDRIASFTRAGSSSDGAELEADIVVTATGLNLLAFGGMYLAVDGEAVSPPGPLAYKGMMLSGVPNFAFAIGYTNASWTLKVDLVCEFFCRLLGQMDRDGYRQCLPVADAPRRPAAAARLPRRLRAALDPQVPEGRWASAPWRPGMSYAQDVVTLRHWCGCAGRGDLGRHVVEEVASRGRTPGCSRRARAAAARATARRRCARHHSPAASPGRGDHRVDEHRGARAAVRAATSGGSEGAAATARPAPRRSRSPIAAEHDRLACSSRRPVLSSAPG